ncbi:uncharacterized protein [Prorops nasuta]|uniref:uncharacterized protein n=1 Tax=Prorops nasuta TaxID=863751 RepID=UPI0034CE9AB3
MFIFIAGVNIFIVVTSLVYSEGLALNMRSKSPISAKQTLQSVLTVSSNKMVNAAANSRFLQDDIDNFGYNQRKLRRINTSNEGNSTRRNSSNFLMELSKLANIRIAASENTEKRVFRRWNKPLNGQNNEEKRIEKLDEILDFNPINVKTTGMSKQKIHCNLIQKVYIPQLRVYLPAYNCKFQNKQFVLTSVRFLEDHRPHPARRT